MVWGSKLNWQIQEEKKQKLNRELKEIFYKNQGFNNEKEFNELMRKSKHIYMID